MFYISLFCTIAIILSFFYLIIIATSKYILHDKVENFNLKLSMTASFLVLFSLLTYGLVVVDNRIENATLKDGVVDYSGTLGDLIGGVLNPILALFGILAGGLAFYAQYKANKLIQDQFKIQQFESQFYEMLHLHRENLNEMKIEGYKFNKYPMGKSSSADLDSKVEKSTSGKKMFVTLLNEFEALHIIATKVFKFKYNQFLSPSKKNVEQQLEQFIIDHSYYVFFSGISLYEKNIDRYMNDDETGFLRLVLKDFVTEIKDKRNAHSNLGIKQYNQYYNSGSILANNFRSKNLNLSFNYKPFSGHQSKLAHYYRHLFQTVKFVVKQDEKSITYESKRDYLRILRSMLSNHEQILLYYNWIAGFGNDWEQKDLEKRKNKQGNYFFTDFRMIHNINEQMIIDEFLPSKVFVEEYLNFRYEKGRRENDPLFELIGIKSGL
ncbi:MAG: putative phage abortive infection protein [Bacteroidetes bacterium]|nr:putative phage abortive infection protein [Bacteroidota bacterium]